MTKWWVAPERVELEKGNKLKHGRLGGVSVNEQMDNYSVTAYITSLYDQSQVERFNIHPFKLAPGVEITTIKSSEKSEPINMGDAVRKMNNMIRRSSTIKNL